MKSRLATGCCLCLLTLLLFPVIGTENCQGQKLKIMASNTFNGAMNGALLGGATMALQNNEDFAPVRFGVGLGTLGGMAIGIHDVTKIGDEQKYTIDGTFNSGDATTIIILLDTIYGSATGSIVGTAITLMTRDPIVKGVQYGSGAGAWGGFVFGLMDAFYLSNKKVTSAVSRETASTEGGLVSIAHKSATINFLQPDIYSYTTVTTSEIKRKTAFKVNMINMHISL